MLIGRKILQFVVAKYLMLTFTTFALVFKTAQYVRQD